MDTGYCYNTHIIVRLSVLSGRNTYSKTDEPPFLKRNTRLHNGNDIKKKARFNAEAEPFVPRPRSYDDLIGMSLTPPSWPKNLSQNSPITPPSPPFRPAIAPPSSSLDVRTTWQQLSFATIVKLDAPPSLVMEGLEKAAGPMVRALSSHVIHTYLSRGPPLTISFS